MHWPRKIKIKSLTPEDFYRATALLKFFFAVIILWFPGQLNISQKV